MKKLDFYSLFYIFFIVSILGWVIEGVYTYFYDGLLLNHSAVVLGPFNMIYGFGACFFTILLYKNINASYLKIFITGFIGATIMEYIMSLGMELFLGFSAWDYSHKFMNINGRVCLLYSIFWGLLAILWIKVCYPLVTKFINKMQPKFKKILANSLIIFLLFDILLTVSAVVRAKACDKGIPPQNNYEKILDKTFNSKYLKNMFNNSWE